VESIAALLRTLIRARADLIDFTGERLVSLQRCVPRLWKRVRLESRVVQVRWSGACLGAPMSCQAAIFTIPIPK